MHAVCCGSCTVLGDMGTPADLRFPLAPLTSRPARVSRPAGRGLGCAGMCQMLLGAS